MSIHPEIPIFYLLWQLLLLAVLFDMTARRRTPASMIAWFLVIFSIPYAGVLLYLFLGRRKIEKTPFKAEFSRLHPSDTSSLSPIESVLHRHGIPPACTDNDFTLITDGTEAYTALRNAIAESRRSIWLATYIFEPDDVMRPLMKLLAAKAHEGVDVRILIDAVGSLGLYLRPSRLDTLTAAGVKIAFFMPLRPFWRNTHFNLRLHRKIYLFDHRTAFSGGMNLSRDYFGPHQDPKRWNDILFCIVGPAVATYKHIFVSDWNFSCDDTIKLSSQDMTIQRGGSQRLQIVPSGPDIASDALYDALLNAIFNARKRIWIVTPYFIPDEATMHALRIAHIKEIDIKIITPKTPDHFIFEVARSSYMREIAEWGGDIAIYDRTMLHAKAVLIDDDHVMVGSLNFDQRSLFLNYEVVCLGHGGAIFHAVEAWMQTIVAQCHHGLAPVSLPRKILENLGRIVAPQL